MIYAFIDKQRQELALSDVIIDKIYDNHRIYVNSDNEVYVSEIIAIIDKPWVRYGNEEQIKFNEGDVIYLYGELLSTALDLKDIGFKVIDVNFKIVNAIGIAVVREL